MRRSIVWFKTDLRLEDNETFYRAVANGDQIIPVYCFDEDHFKTSAFGFKKTGNYRAKFLLESLADLDAHLRALGSGLLVIKGQPAKVICDLIKAFGVNTIYAKHEIAHEEHATEKQLIFDAFKLGCLFKYYDSSTLYTGQGMPFAISNVPEIFTDFRKETEKNGNVDNLFKAPDAIHSPELPRMQLPSLAELGLEMPVADPRAVMEFKGGAREAQKQLHYYFFERRLLSTYKTTRNGLVGRDYSSKFSAWLAMGCISPKQIYYEVKRYESEFGADESTYWLVFELLWRDYFRYMMEKHGKNYFLKNGIKTVKKTTSQFDEVIFGKWIDGTTGNDFVDANMLELKLTGFMSNRGRQNVASYLCKDLKLDWRYGAAYFEQQLIDYDVSSNWCNWAYVAGGGDDPRRNRDFNTEKQANEYDGNGTYRNLWLTLS